MTAAAARSSNPVPFSEPPWLAGLPSPYYTPSHRRWQAACRAFISDRLTRHAVEWEVAETVPAHVYGDFAAANMLAPNLPAPLPAAWLRRLGLGELPGGLSVDEFDYTHQAIYTSEVGAACPLMRGARRWRWRWRWRGCRRGWGTAG